VKNIESMSFFMKFSKIHQKFEKMLSRGQIQFFEMILAFFSQNDKNSSKIRKNLLKHVISCIFEHFLLKASESMLKSIYNYFQSTLLFENLHPLPHPERARSLPTIS